MRPAQPCHPARAQASSSGLQPCLPCILEWASRSHFLPPPFDFVALTFYVVVSATLCPNPLSLAIVYKSVLWKGGELT